MGGQCGVGDGKSISKCQPWGQREEAKSRSGVERRDPFCESLGNPDGRAVMAPLPGVFVKGVRGQDLARGREGVLWYWVSTGWERGFSGTIPQISRTGRRRVAGG